MLVRFGLRRAELLIQAWDQNEGIAADHRNRCHHSFGRLKGRLHTSIAKSTQLPGGESIGTDL